MATEQQFNAFLTTINDAEEKANNFLSKINTCISTGRGLMSDGNAIVASFKELQLARQRQENELTRMLADIDDRRDRFNKMRPFIEDNLKRRMNQIEQTKQNLLNILLNGENDKEVHAVNTVLKMLEMEHSKYFAELDRLLYL